MSEVIGRVRLSRGRVGYFDELTRIHLTISKPEALVLAGMNTANLKRAVRASVLHLVSGSLELEKTKVAKDVHVTEETKAAAKQVEEAVVMPAEAPVEEAKAEDKVEAVEVAKEAEEPKTEAPEEDTSKEEVKAEEAKEEEPAVEEAKKTKAATKSKSKTTNK